MLLLTDRLHEGQQLQQAMGTIGPCTVAALHQALAAPTAHSIIVCDVGFDNVTSIELARTALSHYRTVPNMPVLCLARDPSQLTHAHARAMGATAILPYGTPHAKLLAMIRQLTGARNGSQVSDERMQASVKDAGQALSEMFDAARRRKPVPAAALDNGANAVIAAIGKASIRAWLDVVWKYDDITYQHCLLVAGLEAAFAARLGLSLKSQRLLSQAALVHDIGKAYIPHSILTKPGKLSPAETRVMRTHAALGYDVLAGQAGIDAQLLDIVRHHHEYLDGSGYPDGLRGDDVSQFVRITTICDIYAALIERRSYKEPAPPDKALAILVDMGQKLDGGLLTLFQDVARAT